MADNRNPRQFKIDYDFEPNYNCEYDLETELWYKEVKYAYAEDKEFVY